jgi:hypothetical protein
MTLLLVLLLPLLSTVTIVITARRIGAAGSALLACANMFLSLVCACSLFMQSISKLVLFDL